MAFFFHRSLSIPLWAIAFCAVALASPSRVASFMALLGVTAIATILAGRWVATFNPAPLPQIHDTFDLSRLDDDGGWHLPSKASRRRGRRR